MKERARVELAQDVQVGGEGDDMAKLMGFSGFGTSKK